jgi:hypothetical protein
MLLSTGWFLVLAVLGLEACGSSGKAGEAGSTAGVAGLSSGGNSADGGGGGSASGGASPGGASSAAGRGAGGASFGGTHSGGGSSAGGTSSAGKSGGGASAGGGSGVACGSVVCAQGFVCCGPPECGGGCTDPSKGLNCPSNCPSSNCGGTRCTGDQICLQVDVGTGAALTRSFQCITSPCVGEPLSCVCGGATCQGETPPATCTQAYATDKTLRCTGAVP